MSKFYDFDGIDLRVVSVKADYSDVLAVQRKHAIDICAPKTDGNDTTNTRIMHGDAVANKYRDGTFTPLVGGAISKACLVVTNAGSTTYANLYYYDTYLVKEYAYDTTRDEVTFYGPVGDLSDVEVYSWGDTGTVDENNDPVYAFVYNEAYSALDFHITLIQHGPLALHEGLLVKLVKRTIDVDEDGPYVQKAIPVSGSANFYTQFSIYKETITDEYSASFVESTDCDAVPIQSVGGEVTTKKYKPLTKLQGLEYLNNMRSIRHPNRGYAPAWVCNAATQVIPVVTNVDKTDPENPVITVEWREIVGKESNYSLTNTIRHTEFWPEALDALKADVTAVHPCGTLAERTQTTVSGATYVIGYFSTPNNDQWGGVQTATVPQITSYKPRFTHVEFDVESNTITWQEQTTNSYILFNNFTPEGEKQLGVAPFGAGGPIFSNPFLAQPAT